MKTREAVVEEARSFIGTPYHPCGMVKGVGVDCATFIYLVCLNCGLCPEESIGVFAGDWWCHVTTEVYMLRIARWAKRVGEAVAYRKVDESRPGDIVLMRAASSKVYNHGCIVTKWPLIVHAIVPRVAEVDASRDPMWSYQQIAIFDPWEIVRS